jgi:HEAT repeat protein
MAELLEADATATQADLLLRLGRSGEASAVAAVRPWTASPEPSVRAAAYEALGRLLERAPAALEPYLRTGLADADARVRRRVVLAAATARGVSPGELLDPLREDPDPQVRRVVREVLRQAPPDDPAPHAPPGGGRRRHAEALPPTAPEDRPPAAASRATRDPSAPKRSRRR